MSHDELGLSSSRSAYLEQCKRTDYELLKIIACIPFPEAGSVESRDRLWASILETDIDGKLWQLVNYFSAIPREELLVHQVHHQTLFRMAELGLVRVLAKALVEFVLWDRRECRTVVKNVSYPHCSR